MESFHSALLHTIQAADTDGVKELLQHSECEQVAMDAGLCLASRYGHTEMISNLILHGANPNAEVWGGFTPLLWAAMFNSNPEVIINIVAQYSPQKMFKALIFVIINVAHFSL